MAIYGKLWTDKTPQATRDDIRETFRKWRAVQDFDILPKPVNADSATVEFWANGEKRTLSCDRFASEYNSATAYRTNLRAVYLTLEALRLADERGILRELAQAAAGFLEAPKERADHRPWHEVLGVMPTADVEVIQAAYKANARKAHPDAGGTDAAMADLNEAYEQAKRERAF